MVDRWRQSLDVLLVFLGLFSAIVTAFFVDSVQNLRQDDLFRTNELLSNLTEVVIILSGTPVTSLNLASSEPFVPDPSSIRVNFYWSLALVLSISTAALAVASRAFLSMITQSTGSACERLVDIHSRSEQAKRILGPAIETLPVIIFFPVALFLIGLLDSIFSSAIQLSQPPGIILAAAAASLAVILIVGAIISYSMVHACMYPTTSPFRTTISQFLRLFLSRVSHLRLERVFEPPYGSSQTKNGDDSSEISYSILRTVVAHIIDVCISFRIRWPSDGGPSNDDVNDLQLLSMEERVYHSVLQTTHDDDALDDASAALISVFDSKISGSISCTILLSSLEVKTLVHLLSPEASYRSNLNAAQAIMKLDALTVFDSSLGITLDTSICDLAARVGLLEALSSATQREYTRFNSTHPWDSIFTQAIALLVHPHRHYYSSGGFSLLSMFTSNYVLSPDRLSDAERKICDMTINHAFSTLFERLQNSGEKDAEDLDAAISDLLGPRDPKSLVTSFNVATCLCRWSGYNIFSRKKVSETIRRRFDATIFRWLWSNSSPSKFSDDIRQLTLELSKQFYNGWLHSKTYGTLLSELILIRHHQPRSLDENLLALRTFQTPAFGIFDLAGPVLKAIASLTAQNRYHLSQKLAEDLVSTYNFISSLDSYKCTMQADRRLAEREKQNILTSFWEIWKNVCGPDCVGSRPGGGLILDSQRPTSTESCS